MIGYYNYTVLLTYLSLASATTGIVISLTGTGHPFIGMFFMLFCALCDAFDGRVARTKKNRTTEECKYGIQIDSLSDIVAFGVLPACIGAALVFRSEIYQFGTNGIDLVYSIICFAIMAFFVLAGLIRLAYFNVTEEERQANGEGARKYYLGLPITLGSMILPAALAIVLIVEKLAKIDFTLFYFGALLGVGIAFISKFRLRKPGIKILLGMIGFGALEAGLMIYALLI
ncbi:MAG: CDP-alcohol phosphatidyltransferase family protein [Clostridia bacterium]|nr:CDP-alcohol phosphatidyltransferase family protein [Clostridia bacterium]MBQ9743609.1 CDP-alcohol phosphatidyltransferase family protein [Clostridia bacterium]